MSNYSATFLPALDELAKARNWLKERLPTFFLENKISTISDETVGTMILCLSEVIANTVDYARPMATLISVQLYLSDGKVCIEINDDGATFHDFDTAIESARRSHDEPSLDERGRGLYFLGNMCADLRYIFKEEDDEKLNRTVLMYHAGV